MFIKNDIKTFMGIQYNFLFLIKILILLTARCWTPEAKERDIYDRLLHM
jgi:hypothetical protein